MGIKPSYIKTMGTALMEQHGASFNNNFDDNKRVVSEVTTIESKIIRNRVAGFITRQVNTNNRRRSIITPAHTRARSVRSPVGFRLPAPQPLFLSVHYRIVFRISASYCHGQFGFLCMSKRSYM